VALRAQRAAHGRASGRAAPALVSVRLQRGNADDVLLWALHGARSGVTWRAKLRYAATTAALLSGRRAGAALYAASAAAFWWRRARGGPRSAQELGTLALTSALIPPAASGTRSRASSGIGRPSWRDYEPDRPGKKAQEPLVANVGAFMRQDDNCHHHHPAHLCTECHEPFVVPVSVLDVIDGDRCVVELHCANCEDTRIGVHCDADLMDLDRQLESSTAAMHNAVEVFEALDEWERGRALRRGAARGPHPPEDF
jgi:hypothetical protein